MSLSEPISFEFEHWYYEFTEDDMRISSPNKNITTTKQSLRSALHEKPILKNAGKKEGLTQTFR